MRTRMFRSGRGFPFSLLPALLLAFVLLAPPVFAGEAEPLAQDEAAEKRLVEISTELRCLVCQNESLAGSRADLAMDLKREIRSQIQAGKSDAEIMDFMVSRYGDFVRYRPPVNPVTWLLWFGPFVLLAGAVYGLVRIVRTHQRDAKPQPLDEAQRAKAQSILQAPDRLP